MKQNLYNLFITFQILADQEEVGERSHLCESQFFVDGNDGEVTPKPNQETNQEIFEVGSNWSDWNYCIDNGQITNGKPQKLSCLPVNLRNLIHFHHGRVSRKLINEIAISLKKWDSSSKIKS